MADFISAGAIEAGLTLPEDALGHSQVARRLLWAVSQLPAGSVISLQGSWGRGKTDVLARLVTAAQQAEVDWLWVNPWQYGTPDLLSPLVLALLERLSPARRASSKGLRKAAQAVVLAGLNFGLKASARTVPAGNLLLDAASAMTDMVGPLFEAAAVDAKGKQPDPDPVARMGQRFAELVDALLEESGGQRLMICVDDLDRCLPDRQVALLQAMRFLISAGARATFVVALDPILARQALVTHYQTDAFDPDQYLDKMFTLRVSLPAVPHHRVAQIFHGHFARPPLGAEQPTVEALISASLGDGWASHIAEHAGAVLCTPTLRNPRLIQRLSDRLLLLLVSMQDPDLRGQRLSLRDPIEARVLIGWLALGERWPDVRAALQSELLDLPRLWPQLYRRTIAPSDNAPLGVAALDSLPAPCADLRQLFGALGGSVGTARLIQQLEDVLQAAGL